MRILILGHARSGSSSLLNYVAEAKGYKAIFEPTNLARSISKYTEAEVWEEENVAVKEIYHYDNGSNSYKERYQKYRDRFDKIVAIYREDIQETYESAAHARLTNSFFTPYSFNESEIKAQERITPIKNSILHYLTLQVSHLKSENFFTITYEGLYYKGTDKKQLDDYLEITGSRGDDILDIKNKLRQNRRGPTSISLL